MTKKNEQVVISGEIVDPESETALLIIERTRGMKNLEARTALALDTLMRGQIPPEAIKTRPGYPDEVKFISHVWAKRTMNAALGPLFDYEVLRYDVWDDGSVNTLNKMTVEVPLPDGTWRKRIITEVGTFEAYPKSKKRQEKDKETGRLVTHEDIAIDPFTGKTATTMCTADRVASAASRGFVRCLETAFGIGLDLKDEEKLITPEAAWNQLLKLANKLGVATEKVTELMKEAGLKYDNLAGDFQKAFEIVYNYARSLTEEEVPEDLK
jgi:hypothetical protein